MPYRVPMAVPASSQSDIAEKVWSYSTRVLTDLTKAYFDSVVGTRADSPLLSTLFAAVNALGYETPELISEITPGNVETALLEVLQSAEPDYWMFSAEGYVDLSAMQAGDTVVIKEYAKTGTLELYTRYATHIYNGVQSDPLAHFSRKTEHVAWKITGQQTAGVNRQFRSVAYVRRIG